MERREIEKSVMNAQRRELTEYFVYKTLSKSAKDAYNKKILQRIADDELRHYNFWKTYTHKDAGPKNLKLWRYILISRIFGITFGLKLMEKSEKRAQVRYDKFSKSMPGARKIIKEEGEHEKKLTGLIDEERLKYTGAVVLGLNDALVELTGTLAGFTLALQNTHIIAMAGLISGISAAFSMGASEYLSTKSEESKSPMKAALYTSSAYVLTVLFLVLPYMLLRNIYLSLGITIFNAIMVIFLFNFYISVTNEACFRKRFFEMALVSLGVAALSFGVGYLIRVLFNI